MAIWAGTSGFSYKEWKGSFYPEECSPKEMLTYYASKLPAVEINSTFYRLPKVSVIESWADQVPADFRFSIKASRRITHQKRLKDAADETAYLLETTAALNERLGVILFQLPPFLRKGIERLAGFLELIPEGLRAAFEFRHDSWFDDEVYDALRRHGCALCIADTGGKVDTPLVSTTDWGYLRLRRSDYDEGDLALWAERVSDLGWSETFAFFKHEDAGSGPRLAARFLELCGSSDPD